jgi:hypothetical protein
MTDPSAYHLLGGYFFAGDQLGQAALLPGGRVGMDDALAACAVEQGDCLGVGLLGRIPGGGPHLLERGPQLTALGPVDGGTRGGLPHALLGGLDSGHDDLA